MKNNVKLLAGVIAGAVIICSTTLLIIKYFDVLTKVFYDVKKQFLGDKRPSFLADACCGAEDEDEDE